MKFYNLKYFFLFLILLIISQSVFCQETDTDKVATSTGDNNNDQPTDSSQTSVTTTVDDKIPIETTSVNYQPSSISTTTIIINTRTTDKVTSTSSSKTSKTPTPTSSGNKHNDDHHSGSSSSSGNNSSNTSNVSNSGSSPIQQPEPQPTQQTQPVQDQPAQDQPAQDQQQQALQQDQNPNQSTNVPNGTANTIGTIDSKGDSKKKKNDGVPVWCIILGCLLVGALLIGTVGFVMSVQRKKKNNESNIWTADDFDARVNPITAPANTYNMNVPISQPMYQQTTYGQTPVMSEAYNAVQSTPYADPNAQLPPTSGVAIPVDNSYSNDYPNGNSNEYIPTSIDELKVNNVYSSQFTFQPELEDEIEINIDDQIFIEEIFADNWALGVNTSTNARGCFPLNIFLNPKSTLDNSRSQRTLSYCSTGNGPSY